MAGPIDRRLLTRARATRGFLVASVAVGSATALLVVAQAWLLSRVVARAFDAASTPGAAARFPFGGLAAALGVLAVVLLGRAGLAWLGSWLAHRSAAAVKSQLRADIIDARLSAPGATRVPTGQLSALLTQGLDALDGYYARYLPQLALALTVPAIVGVAILTADFTSTVVVALTLPLIPVFMVLIGLATKARMNRSWRVQTRLANHFGDLVAGLPTLQVFGRARAQERGLVITERRHRSETMSTLRVSFLSSFVLELLATYSVALVAVPIGLRLVEGHLSLATGLFVLILVPECYLPVRQVGVHYHDSVDGIAAADEAFAIIEGAQRTGGSTAPSAGVPIRFAGVGVRHAGSDVDSLSDFSMTLAPGEVVALTGPSGCGKSTALAVLMGFLVPSAGRVMVGDADLAELDLARWRRSLAWVGQQPGVVAGTIADNVRLGDPDADEAAVTAALRAAGAEALAPERPVGDDGSELSAGELRRVAVARALLRLRAGAGLLVLDEPTAGLDADAEARVIESVRRSGAGALVVTHRPAVLAAADRVVRLGVPRVESVVAP
ncbi:thiol reductant ABC exporter subunit CydD [Naumannella sp. ID2617S]|nr:thiol reductant ABC exporter subunit CydD [Naumannella sp. ID2617S]